MRKTIFLLGSGFTKAALPHAPTNAELTSKLIQQFGSQSKILKYKEQFATEDIEVILTQLDMRVPSNESMKLARRDIETDLVNYFRDFRFTTAALSNAPWLTAFATEVLGQDDAIISLNYDCFLEGLLDYSKVWTPNTGYYGVDNVLIEAGLNPKRIVVYKIHGSEHFRISSVTDRPDQDAIAFEFNNTIFPVSAANSNFGAWIDSSPYLIAPRFVKIPHRQIAMMMLRLLELICTANNFVIIGCGLRREDSFLWLLLTRFLMPKDEKHLIIVDPYADTISKRINQYWIGDLQKYTKVTLLPLGLESSILELSSLLRK
ncbi:MAG: hypothetical protein WA435_08885 [Gallionellaceae bacterium]